MVVWFMGHRYAYAQYTYGDDKTTAQTDGKAMLS